MKLEHISISEEFKLEFQGGAKLSFHVNIAQALVNLIYQVVG